MLYASTLLPILDEVCRKYLRKVSRVRGSAGAIESRSREWASTNLKPEATFVSVSFPTHTEREDEEDLADRCRFDRSTRGSVIRIDERDCAFGDGGGSHVSGRASRNAYSCLLRFCL